VKRKRYLFTTPPSIFTTHPFIFTTHPFIFTPPPLTGVREEDRRAQPDSSGAASPGTCQ
jgi:hypothetical protein